jgi:lipopolysaccharide transport system ATP-binding protein
MSDVVIKAENLGKKYTIGHHAEDGRYVTLRDVVMRNARSFWRSTKDLLQGRPIILGDTLEEVWALRDVSFEIQRGEAVGIIGRNGAGKSTLLKILSRITEPSSGRVTIKGRVASLLEVGTGFNPELTGRENIYLNGSVLGMTRVEIRRKFDEIVAFAEVEKFLDTPVKRYSSGMYVRLAFAVAAHLEPEILIVDEVLAVGDLAFQKKCMGKMGEVSSKEGRTVLFVSHNMQAISELCKSAYLLDKGTLLENGNTKEVVDSYVYIGFDIHQSWKCLNDNNLRNQDISNPLSIYRWTEIFILNSRSECVNNIYFYEPFEIVFRGYAQEECDNIRIGFGINSKRIGLLFSTHQFYNDIPNKLPPGFSEFHVRMEPNILAPGYYDVGIAADGNAKVADYIMNDAISFSISNVSYDHEKQWRASINTGILYYPCKWSLNFPVDTENLVKSKNL